jgi:hypothetical protein
MGRPSACNCCEDPLPDCFGCTGQSKTITDVRAEIGDGMGWDKPFFQECDVPVNVYWPGGLNCDLWGPVFGTECGVLSAAGSTHVKFHSSGISPFNGSNLLQRNPTGGCTWKKRDLKLLQQVYRDTYTGATPAGNVIGYHVENVTYPYADPVDPLDQWSDPVYPDWDPGLSVDELLYAIRVNSTVSTTLTLTIETLRMINTGGGLYDCWKDIPVRGGVNVPSVGGDKYWVLELVSNQKWAGSTVIYSTGNPAGPAGLSTGNSRPYDGRLGGDATLDTRNPAKDLAACPPYIKTSRSEYCGVSGVVGNENLLSGYDATILRWVKKVDCANDFLGSPITLSLTTPRSFVDSPPACQCLDFEINARKFGLTGYSTNATITLLP